MSDLLPFPDDWTRALCVVAHPDDLEYGAAAAIASWTAAGRTVSYLLVTRGEAGIDGMTPDDTGPLREAEERASAAVVGVDTVDFLEGHVDGVIEYGLPLRRDLAAVIRRVQPDLVVSMNHTESWGGLSFNMADHRHVGLAALDASRDAGNRWIFTDAGDPWSGVRRVAMGGSTTPTHFVDVGDSIDTGIASLREHAAYIAGLGTEFDADAFLRGNARAAGESAGCEYATTFQLYEL
ncbi:MAG TPA: PIG-L deacetylase family protein [Acidimicrobiia bacterium]|jgi:LmbE family N-acetylglucosaminyl deacetylase